MAARPRILIAGSGPGALEAALALGASEYLDAEIALVSPATEFRYTPNLVIEPFGGSPPSRYNVGEIIKSERVVQWQGTIERIDAGAGRAFSPENDEFEFDAAILATGTRFEPLLPAPAISFGAPGSIERVKEVLAQIDSGGVRAVAFAAPEGPSYRLPLYELALMTADRARAAGQPVALGVVTPEAAPLEAFGSDNSDLVARLCVQAGISLVCGEAIAGFDGEQVAFRSGGQHPADQLIAMPRLVPRAPEGVPTGADGFVPTQAAQLITGTTNIYAVGDMTDFPVKQGGLASAQARAAVSAIEARLGSRPEAEEFDGEIGGVLLGADGRVSLRARVTRDGAESLAVGQTSEPLKKIDSEYLSRRLDELAPLLP